MKKIDEIDNTLEIIKGKMEARKNDADKKDTEAEVNDNARKQCKYNRKGHCRELDECEFFHSNIICDIYLEKGTCWKQKCSLRHPKPCRYGDQSYRGKSCLYLHHDLTCGKCENFSTNLYFCEFCTKSFCQNCTHKEAHAKNVYEETENPKCEQIHQ